MQSIPLQNLSSSSPSDDACLTSSSPAQRIPVPSSHESSLPASSHQPIPPAAAAVAQPQPPAAGQVAGPPVTNVNANQTGAVARFKSSVGNVIGVLGLIFAVGLGLFTAITSYLDMSWSEHADAVQTCISLLGIGHTTAFCNATIWEGIDRTPLIRRSLKGTMSALRVSSWILSPGRIAATIALTLASILYSTVFTRPRMRPFAPVVSYVRQNWNLQATTPPEEVLLPEDIGYIKISPDIAESEDTGELLEDGYISETSSLANTTSPDNVDGPPQSNEDSDPFTEPELPRVESVTESEDRMARVRQKHSSSTLRQLMPPSKSSSPPRIAIMRSGDAFRPQRT